MLKTAILLVVLQLAIGANLPDKFKRCHVKDPKSSSCFKVAVADALRKIGTTGIPSLNVEPLQPMVVKEVKIDQGGEGPVSIKVQFTNLKIYGIPQSSVVSFGLDNYEIEAEALTPEVKIDADYVLEGQILLLPIRGTGKSTITMDSLVTHHNIKGKPVTRNGEIYWDLQKYDIKMRVKQMSLIFRNLFNGDKALGETMNEVLNENWEVLFKELRPALEKAFGEVFLKYAKGIFDNVPYNTIFLE